MENKLVTAVWELTNACNANCIHCGSRSGSRREHELTEEEAMKLCDDFHTLGCESVTLIGGEMFLSPYWEKVCARLVELGIRPAPLTNGLLVNASNLEKMKRAGVDNVAFSIDGLAKVHDHIRGVPGLFDKMIANIRLAQETGLRVGVNSAISALNVEEIPGIYRLLCDLHIPAWQVQIVEDMGSASENPELRLTGELLYQAAKYVAKFRSEKKIRIYVSHNLGWFVSFEPLLRDHPFTGCVAGKYLVGIQSNGDVRGCLSIMSGEPGDNVEDNLRNRSLVEIWNDPDSFAPFRYRKVENLTGFCATCKYRDLCRGGCSSVAYSLLRTFSENPLCLYRYETENGLRVDEELA